MKNKWPVTDQARLNAIQMILELATDPDPAIRARALKLLIEADKLNATREAIQVSREPKQIIHHQGLTQEQLLAKIQENAEALGMGHLVKGLLPGETDVPRTP